MPPASNLVDPRLVLFLGLGVLIAGVACRPEARVASPQSLPAASSLDTIVAMDFGRTMSCAVHRSGRVTCRGNDRPIHVRSGVSDAAGVALAGEDVCVWTRSGTVGCAPYFSDSPPTPVAFPGEVVQLAAGAELCALTRGGDVACTHLAWRPPRPPRPSPLTSRHDAVELVADGEVHCVRHANGSSSCALPDLDGALAVYALPEITGAHGLTLEDLTVCALTARGAPECLELSREQPVTASPLESPALPPLVALGAGKGFKCGLSRSGAVTCWGARHLVGQLGEPNAHSGVATVHGIDDAEAVFVGPAQACARRRDGNIWCWGDDEYGAVGDGLRARIELPREPWHLDGLRQMTVADNRTCARRGDGSLACWGTPSAWTTPTPVPVPEPVEFLASNEYFDCALLRSGKVACRAARPSWQADDPQPSQGWWTIPELDHVVAFTIAYNIGSSLHDDGTVRLWSIHPRDSVFTWPELFDGRAVAFAFDADYALRTLVLTRDGRVVCGAADCPFGQPLTGVTAIAAGLEFFCTLRTDESLHCAGLRTQFRSVQLRGRHAAVAASERNLCALSADRKLVKCWGGKSFGQPTRDFELGFGITRIASLPAPARDIVVGDRHMCAVFSDERLTCWGSNRWGELGDGRSGVKLVPAPYPQL